MNERGEGDAKTIEALESFVEKSCETATYLVDKSEIGEAEKVLDECMRVFKKQVT